VPTRATTSRPFRAVPVTHLAKTPADHHRSRCSLSKVLDVPNALPSCVGYTSTGPPRITPGVGWRPTALPGMPRSGNAAAHVAGIGSRPCQTATRSWIRRSGPPLLTWSRHPHSWNRLQCRDVGS